MNRPLVTEMLAWPETWAPGERPEDIDRKEDDDADVDDYFAPEWAEIGPLDADGKAHYRGIGMRRLSIDRRFHRGEYERERLRNPNLAVPDQPVETHDDVDPETGFNRTEWMKTEPTWKERIAGPKESSRDWQLKRWKGTKYLGQGANGIIGLWEREESGLPNSPESKLPEEINKVVVKQQKVDPEFEREVSMFQKLGTTGSKHLVKMYKAATVNESGYDVGILSSFYSPF